MMDGGIGGRGEGGHVRYASTCFHVTVSTDQNKQNRFVGL